LASNDALYQRCIGVLYNKVNMRKMRFYEGAGSKDYYHDRYSKYYHENKA
jgi:succinoglycan biosynthesis transport protein ExoP